MTVHDTPIIKSLMRLTALMVFKLKGWRAEGHRQGLQHYLALIA